ncbi:MAG: type II toxin-antitoxin system prevent-host-death family antitoxin [Microbacterium sp.]|uniref:type II toxin-antitoxin system Phd/YefM family antitoxin n=1 Tax=Microbacterium sp. TaxID=51671 RepID=UPI0039E5162C
MPTISHREMRNQSSRVLREVAAGECFTVTNDGVPVAILAPAAATRAELTPARPATRHGGIGSLPRHRLDGTTLAETLDDLRDGR